MIGLTTSWWLASLLGFFFSCQPFSYNWNSNQEGHCHDKLKFWTAVAAAHMVIEIIILLLPLPMVWKLQLPLRRKFGLSVLFALGILWASISPFFFSLFFFSTYSFTLIWPLHLHLQASASQALSVSISYKIPTKVISQKVSQYSMSGLSSNQPLPSALAVYPSRDPSSQSTGPPSSPDLTHRRSQNINLYKIQLENFFSCHALWAFWLMDGVCSGQRRETKGIIIPAF